MRTVFILAGVTAQLDGGSSKILLGDNSGGGAVTLSLINVQRVEVWTLTPTHTHIQLTTCIISSNFCQTFQNVTITQGAVCLYKLRNAPPIRRHIKSVQLNTALLAAGILKPTRVWFKLSVE